MYNENKSGVYRFIEMMCIIINTGGNMEDSKIVQLFFQRNEEAIKEVSIKYSAYCSKIVWNILYNKEDCDECLNDIWFTLWSRIPPDCPKCLSAFAGKIARGLAIDRYRKKNAAKRTDTHMVYIEEEVAEICGEYSMEKEIDSYHIREILNDFLGKLSKKDRDIFVRRYWYMDTIREIAQRHHISETNVKSNLFRSRKKLLKAMEREGIL